LKRVFKIALSVVLIFILIAAGGIFYISRGIDEGSKVVVNPVNIVLVNDGSYTGKYNSGRWTNELKIIVNNHRITKIDVVKDVTFSKPEWREELFSRVIEKQNVDVDVVTGATVTSKAYLKAIENAFKK
jgi:uncharacterized protein with FMN-binding domain